MSDTHYMMMRMSHARVTKLLHTSGCASARAHLDLLPLPSLAPSIEFYGRELPVAVHVSPARTHRAHRAAHGTTPRGSGAHRSRFTQSRQSWSS
eukprot:3293310-Prymnesium_polylepis.1